MLKKTVTATKKPSLRKSAPVPDGLQGEGNYNAARRHRASVRKFIQSGQVEDAAREAEPKTPVEEEALFDAERAGKERSKGEDPALKRASRRRP
ncbi:MAG: hypothetical protein V4792_09315 [Pseudomonadota bacterium]